MQICHSVFCCASSISFNHCSRAFLGAHCKLSSGTSLFFHITNFLSFELNSCHLYCCAEFFHCCLLLHRVFYLLFVVASEFSTTVHCCTEFPAMIHLLHRVFCCYLFLCTVQKSLFSFAVQRLFLSFVGRGYCSLFRCAEVITIYCCTPAVYTRLTYINIMTTPQRKRKNVRSGKVVRFEPHNLNLVNADPTIRVSFEQVDA
jgi:hypothetical protein